MGARSEAVNVNIILRNQLESLLRQWWNNRVSFPEMTRRINAMIADEAATSGAEPSVYDRQAVQRWCYVVYELGEPRGSS